MTKVTEELNQEARVFDRQLRNDAELFEVMVKTPAWKRFVELVESSAKSHFETVNAPLANIFEVTRSEYAKGTLNGLSHAATIPYTRMQEAKELRPAGDNEE